MVRSWAFNPVYGVPVSALLLSPRSPIGRAPDYESGYVSVQVAPGVLGEVDLEACAAITNKLHSPMIGMHVQKATVA